MIESPALKTSLYADGGEVDRSAAPLFFFRREGIYKSEWRIAEWCPVPLWRVVATILLIYSFILAVLFTASLCTHGAKVIAAFTLIFATVYCAWAIWWDESYAVPPTWTFLKNQGFNAFWIIICLLYQTFLVAIVGSAIIIALIINFADVSDIFQWECKGEYANG